MHTDDFELVWKSISNQLPTFKLHVKVDDVSFEDKYSETSRNTILGPSNAK